MFQMPMARVMVEMPKAVKYMEREVNLGGCSIMKKRMWKKRKPSA
jgi:hypothetical protein